MNQAAKFGPRAVLGILKRLDNLDFAMGPTEFQKLSSNGLDIFVNISNSVNNQRLIFDVPTVLGLLNNTTGSDLNCGAKKRSDFEKKIEPYITAMHTVAAAPFCPFTDSVFQRGESLTWEIHRNGDAEIP